MPAPEPEGRKVWARVTICSAKNLKGDEPKRINSYFVLKFGGGDPFRTKIKRGTAHPRWTDEYFDFQVDEAASETTLALTCLNAREMGIPEVIGKANVSLISAEHEAISLPMFRRGPEGANVWAGSVELELDYDIVPDPQRAAGAARGVQVATAPTTVAEVVPTVFADPLATVCVGDNGARAVRDPCGGSSPEQDGGDGSSVTPTATTPTATLGAETEEHWQPRPQQQQQQQARSQRGEGGDGKERERLQLAQVPGLWLFVAVFLTGAVCAVTLAHLPGVYPAVFAPVATVWPAGAGVAATGGGGEVAGERGGGWGGWGVRLVEGTERSPVTVLTVTTPRAEARSATYRLELVVDGKRVWLGGSIPTPTPEIYEAHSGHTGSRVGGTGGTAATAAAAAAVASHHSRAVDAAVEADERRGDRGSAPCRGRPDVSGHGGGGAGGDGSGGRVSGGGSGALGKAWQWVSQLWQKTHHEAGRGTREAPGSPAKGGAGVPGPAQVAASWFGDLVEWFTIPLRAAQAAAAGGDAAAAG